MRFILSSIVLIAAVTSALGQVICPLIYSPVCGSDGKTYANDCLLSAAHKRDSTLTLSHRGLCKDLTIVKREAVFEDDYECPEISKHGACTLEYNPMCGTNGKTYANRCMVCIDMYKGEADLRVAHPGECQSNDFCRPEDKTGRCTREYMPVCGSDGKTYSNRCTFCFEASKKQDLTRAHEGECKQEQQQEDFPSDFCLPHYKSGICNRMYAPVCGDDGKTYGNTCEFCYYMFAKQEEGVQLSPKHYGECESEVPTYYAVDQCLPFYYSGICTREYMPICGSDGVTHSNFCNFCYDQHQNYLQSGKNISIAYYGECKAEEQCSPSSKAGICPAIYAPICASDGKTYSSECLMCGEMYRQQQNGNDVVLTKVHNGRCEQATYYNAEFCLPQYKSGACTMEYMPLCGSDGTTYPNKCTFCYAMYKKQDEGNDLHVKRDGACKDEDIVHCPESLKSGVCAAIYSPVCGYDGRTYSNKCMFCAEQARLLVQGKELHYFYAGRCVV